jgi:hypothetical protein
MHLNPHQSIIANTLHLLACPMYSETPHTQAAPSSITAHLREIIVMMAANPWLVGGGLRS